VISPVGVLDCAGLVRLFNQCAGRRFVGAIDCGGDVFELVFEDLEGEGSNLVSVYTEGRHRGLVYLGFVPQELIDGGYGSPGYGREEAA
jgi:hypothetical protein